jgi:hypothetical protein
VLELNGVKTKALAALSWLAWAVLGFYVIVGIFAVNLLALDWAFGISLSLAGQVTAATYLAWFTYLVGSPVLGNTVVRRLVRVSWRWEPVRNSSLVVIPIILVAATVMAFRPSNDEVPSCLRVLGGSVYRNGEVYGPRDTYCENEPAP